MGMIDIDPETIRDPFDPAPPGTYTISCVNGQMEASKKGDAMVHLDFEITDGQPEDSDEDINDHLGKKLRDYMVISGENAKYGLFRLKQYCEVAGIDPREADPEDLIGYSFDVAVNVQPGDEQYGPSNSIAKVFTEA